MQCAEDRRQGPGRGGASCSPHTSAPVPRARPCGHLGGGVAAAGRALTHPLGSPELQRDLWARARPPGTPAWPLPSRGDVSRGSPPSCGALAVSLRRPAHSCIRSDVGGRGRASRSCPSFHGLASAPWSVLSAAPARAPSPGTSRRLRPPPASALTRARLAQEPLWTAALLSLRQVPRGPQAAAAAGGRPPQRVLPVDTDEPRLQACQAALLACGLLLVPRSARALTASSSVRLSLVALSTCRAGLLGDTWSCASSTTDSAEWT